MEIHGHYVTSFVLKGQSWKEVMGELIFYSKIKSFQCFQCLAAVPSHVESLGNLKNKYKIKKVKVRNQTIHNKVQQKQNMRGWRTEPTEKKKKKKKRRGRRTNQQRRRRKKERETEKPTEKKKKKRKEEEAEEEEEDIVASRRHPCFVIVFFLFSFFSVFFPYKWCFGPVSIYRPKQPDFASTVGTRLVRPVFFPIRNKGVICTSALIGTVYIGCTGRYGTELTSLVISPRWPWLQSLWSFPWRQRVAHLFPWSTLNQL